MTELSLETCPVQVGVSLFSAVWASSFCTIRGLLSICTAHVKSSGADLWDLVFSPALTEERFIQELSAFISLWWGEAQWWVYGAVTLMTRRAQYAFIHAVSGRCCMLDIERPACTEMHIQSACDRWFKTFLPFTFFLLFTVPLVTRIWPTAQFRCHGNSSLLQHLLSPTSFSSSFLSPLRLSQGGGPEEAVCAPGPASAPALGLGSPNPFFWR